MLLNSCQTLRHRHIVSCSIVQACPRWHWFRTNWLQLSKSRHGHSTEASVTGEIQFLQSVGLSLAFTSRPLPISSYLYGLYIYLYIYGLITLTIFTIRIKIQMYTSNRGGIVILCRGDGRNSKNRPRKVLPERQTRYWRGATRMGRLRPTQRIRAFIFWMSGIFLHLWSQPWSLSDKKSLLLFQDSDPRCAEAKVKGSSQHHQIMDPSEQIHPSTNSELKRRFRRLSTTRECLEP
jgi:hypothetical protein